MLPVALDLTETLDGVVEHPSAYLITFACYGARLHGHEGGSVDRRTNVYGAVFLEHSRDWERHERRLMRAESYRLDSVRRRRTLDTILAVSKERDWRLHAAHIRSSHVHVVLSAELRPESVMGQLKARCSLSLKELDGTPRRRWSRHGSTRYLWKLEHVDAAVEYVVRGQGAPMAVYESFERWL